jgi:hypothetical protein
MAVVANEIMGRNYQKRPAQKSGTIVTSGARAIPASCGCDLEMTSSITMRVCRVNANFVNVWTGRANFGHKYRDFTSRNLRCRTAPGSVAYSVSNQRGQMASRFGFWYGVAAVMVAVGSFTAAPAAQDGFPFGLEMTLDTKPMPGSRQMPTLEIGDNGEAKLDLWCKSGKGQFSVAGNTVIFAPGQFEDHACPPDRAEADDNLIAALAAIETWKRQGDAVTFAGPATLHFHLNTN